MDRGLDMEFIKALSRAIQGREELGEYPGALEEQEGLPPEFLFHPRTEPPPGAPVGPLPQEGYPGRVEFRFQPPVAGRRK